jgi:hypothetical protein
MISLVVKFKFKDVIVGHVSLIASPGEHPADKFPFNYYQAWMLAVDIYIRCDLAYYTRCLIAISGIARLI